MVRETRAALEDDLGGSESLSAMEQLIVDQVLRNQVLLATIDRYVFRYLEQHGRVWTGRGKSQVVLPVLKLRSELQNGIVRR